MKKLFALFIVATIAYSCKKDEAATCTWQNSTLNDKTYKITKILVNGADVTTTTQASDPCTKNSLKFNADLTVTETQATGCTGSVGGSGSMGGTWKTHIASGKNYLITGTDTNLVSSFDCNSITFSENYNSGGTSVPVLTTFTKQ